MDRFALYSELEELKHFKGYYSSEGSLMDANETALPGDFAYVDLGVGETVKLYIWDDNDNVWTLSSGAPPTKLFRLMGNPFGVNEMSFLMTKAGNVISVNISDANTPKLKIGRLGTYPSGAQTYPFAYDAGDVIYITYNFDDQFFASCNIILNCEDN